MGITGVQLEIGTTATVFESRPYASEFLSCLRYRRQLTGYGFITLNGTDLLNGTVPLIPQMRTTPNLASGAAYTAGSGANGTPGLRTGLGWGNNAQNVIFYNTGTAWTGNVQVSVTAGLDSEL